MLPDQNFRPENNEEEEEEVEVANENTGSPETSTKTWDPATGRLPIVQTSASLVAQPSDTKTLSLRSPSPYRLRETDPILRSSRLSFVRSVAAEDDIRVERQISSSGTIMENL